MVADRDYVYCEPAYRYGWESRSRYRGRKWEDVEKELGTGWVAGRGPSTLEWEEARLATRDVVSRNDRDARLERSTSAYFATTFGVGEGGNDASRRFIA